MRLCGEKHTIIERRQSGHHLVEENTKSPPVDGLVCRKSTLTEDQVASKANLTITLCIENFWCKILWRSTESIRPVAILHVELAETEVTQCDMSVIVKQDVFRLEVTIHNVESMEVLESEEELGAVEPRPLFAEALLLLEMVEQLAAVDKTVQVVLINW